MDLDEQFDKDYFRVEKAKLTQAITQAKKDIEDTKMTQKEDKTDPQQSQSRDANTLYLQEVILMSLQGLLEQVKAKERQWEEEEAERLEKQMERNRRALKRLNYN